MIGNNNPSFEKMIFISAQPDDYYFTWQIELQIHNLNKLGIAPNFIHVIVGYDIKRGLQHFFIELIERNKHQASFYSYPDKRNKPEYSPSIRPHLIQQHFLANPFLEKYALFYHDSDIIFRELPDFESLLRNDLWYVSDTRSYLDSSYIKEAADEATFNGMCEIVNVKPELIIGNDANCGGAQYLLKGTTLQFWKKVEKNCEELFKFLTKQNLQKGDHLLQNREKNTNHNGIQSRCADMWAVLWNAFYFNRKVEISPELDFCWATSDISEWNKSKILHYTGGNKKEDKQFFCKTNYIHYSPYLDLKLKNIDNRSSSYPLIELIYEFIAEQNGRRINLKDVSFLIPIRIDSESRLQNLVIITTYLAKYFDTNILIYESDETSKIPSQLLPTCCTLFFDLNNDQSLHKTRLNNLLIRNAKTPIIALLDSGAILPVAQIEEAVNRIRDKTADFVSPFSGDLIVIDDLFKAMFEKILDPELLVQNKNKFHTITKRSWGGCVFISKEEYAKAGMENEFFESNIPEELERKKRMKNLGYKVICIKGALFQLSQFHKETFSYSESYAYMNDMKEYFKITNMDKPALEIYISRWDWTK